VVSSSSFFFFISSPNLSRHRLDVYHTSTYGVALVRISDAGLKRAARGSLKIQYAKKVAKNHHLGTIAHVMKACCPYRVGPVLYDFFAFYPVLCCCAAPLLRFASKPV